MNTKEKESHQSQEQNYLEAWAEFVPAAKFSDNEPEETPEIRTELPLPARPIVKGGFAVVLSGSALVLVWIFFQLAGGIDWNKEKKSTQEQENQPVAAKPSSGMTAEEKLQWCMAAGKCAEREEPLKKPTTNALADPKVTKRREKREELGVRPHASYRVQDVRRPVRVSRALPGPTPTMLPSQPRPISPVPPVVAVSSRPVAPMPVERRAMPPEQSQRQQKQDPMALLAQASNLGVYSTVRGASPIPSSRRERRVQLAAEQRLVDAGSAEPPTTNLQSGKVIPVTTRIKAAVATGISWAGNKTEQKFRIRTTEDVKAENGSIALPQNTYLLAQVNQSNTSGYLEVQILSAGSNGQEKLIPANAVIVQGTDGEPLQAKVKNKRSGLREMVVAAGLGGISEAASTINSAKILVGGTTTTVSRGSNIGAAVVEGVTDSVSKQISGQVDQAARRTSNGPVLVLKEGTKLELFVNQPLSF